MFDEIEEYLYSWSVNYSIPSAGDVLSVRNYDVRSTLLAVEHVDAAANRLGLKNLVTGARYEVCLFPFLSGLRPRERTPVMNLFRVVETAPGAGMPPPAKPASPVSDTEGGPGALIPLIRTNGKLAVSARELYKFLGLVPTDFTRWARKNITENPYVTENEDWIRYSIYADMPNGGRVRLDDYTLILPLAKKLAMMSRSARGEQVRDYFLECEKRANAGQNIPSPAPVTPPPTSAYAPPKTHAETLRQLAATLEERDRLALTVAKVRRAVR